MRSTLLSFFIAPSAAPVSLQGHNKSSTSIFVTWGPVPLSEQNGVILNYTVSYKEASNGSAQTVLVTVDEPNNSTTLKGLNKYTNYSITVFASTIKGGGIVHAPIFVITDQDSKFVITEFTNHFACALYNISFHCHLRRWSLVMFW